MALRSYAIRNPQSAIRNPQSDATELFLRVGGFGTGVTGDFGYRLLSVEISVDEEEVIGSWLPLEGRAFVALGNPTEAEFEKCA